MKTVKTMTREMLIDAIRAKLIELTDSEHSMCQVATEKGIYCLGFRKFTDEQLRDKYKWLLRRNPNVTRQELEDLANRWQIARQIVDQVPLSCDAQAREHDTCDSWDTFDDATLARYYRELAGEEVLVGLS